jgi:hypothetical protein
MHRRNCIPQSDAALARLQTSPRWARRVFEDLFADRIAKGLNESGDDTWTNGHTAPIPTAFDSVPYKHAKFLETTAGTCVRAWNIEPPNENNLTIALPAKEPSMTVGKASTIIIE